MAASNLTGRQRMQQSFDASLRVGAVVDLASEVGSDTFEGRLSRLDRTLEDLMEHLLERQYPVHPSAAMLRDVVVASFDEDEEEMALVAEALMHKGLLGLVVQFVTPVMTRTGEHSFTFSWGYTQSTWVYAETYADAWKLGVAWAEQCRKDAKAEPKKRAKVVKEH